jgi:ketosteroid isomerase-like protein
MSAEVDAMVSEQSIPRLIEEHYERLLAGDDVAYSALVHEDFVQEWPQTGERVRGKEACLNIARNYPGGPPEIRVVRISGEGVHWVVEGVGRYPDGSDYHIVAVLEMRDGKLARETDFFGPPYPAPEWRRQWVEPIT